MTIEDYQKELEKITAACADLKRRMEEPQDVLGALQDIRRRLTSIESDIKELKANSVQHTDSVVFCQCSMCNSERARTLTKFNLEPSYDGTSQIKLPNTPPLSNYESIIRYKDKVAEEMIKKQVAIESSTWRMKNDQQS